MDTICALSTPMGRAAIALIRISGPRSLSLVTEITGRTPRSRHPEVALLKNKSGKLLDEALVTFYQGPNSYTGEDLVEIGCHGNPTIVEEVLREIVSRETRLAEPGEFTRRALVNKKLTVEQVEALDWILNSPTAAGAGIGLRAKLSGLSNPVTEVLGDLVRLTAELESKLDFSEEEVGMVDRNSLVERIGKITGRLEEWVCSFEVNRSLLEAWNVVLIGAPNSGKSSLFNALIKFEKAIVFNLPGTTRDYLEHSFEIGGRVLNLIDTAGLRKDPDPVEKIGIAKTLKMMEISDVICWVTDTAEMPDQGLVRRFVNQKWVLVSSKSDLPTPPLGDGVKVSVVTEQGLEELKRAIQPPQVTEQDGVLLSDRQAKLVTESVGNLRAATENIESGEFMDMVTEQVRRASRNLNELIGEIPSEDVLKQIFARFCVGK